MEQYIMKTGLVLLLLAATVSAGSFLVIMDASTSMDDLLPTGESRLEAAKAAAKQQTARSSNSSPRANRATGPNVWEAKTR